MGENPIAATLSVEDSASEKFGLAEKFRIYVSTRFYTILTQKLFSKIVRFSLCFRGLLI